MQRRELMRMLNPETRAVFLTAGGAENDEVLRQILAGPISWEQLLITAEWERSLPISWRRISAFSPSIPPEVAQSFERLSAVCGFQSAVLRDRLEEFLRAMTQRDIPVVLLKGAALALTKYDNFSSRPMGDLDLLIAPQHREEAWNAALALGWTWDKAAYPPGKYEQHHHAPPLLDAARTGAKLELHSALSLPSHPFSFTFDEAFAVSVRTPGYGTDIRVLDPEHALLHICIHFAWAHQAVFGLWRLARDAQALASAGIDWARVGELAGRYRAESSVYWSLALAAGVCGVDVAPVKFSNQLRPGGSVVLHGLAARHLAAHVVARHQPCPSEKLRRVMWSLAMQPSRTSGALRPWEESPGPAGGKRKAGRLMRLKGQVGQLRGWAEYLRAMAGNAS